MTMPGSPEIQNLIPSKFFHTTPWAGGVIGIICAAGIAVAGCIYLLRAVKKAVARGEHFEEHLSQIHTLTNAHQEMATAAETAAKRPNFILALLPLLVVVVSLAVLTNGFHIDSTLAAVYSMLSGIFIAWLLMFGFIRQFWGSLA